MTDQDRLAALLHEIHVNCVGTRCDPDGSDMPLWHSRLAARLIASGVTLTQPPEHVGSDLGYAAVPIEPDTIHDPDCCAARGCHRVCSHLCGTDLASPAKVAQRRVHLTQPQPDLPVLDCTYGEAATGDTYDVDGGCLTCGQRFTVRRQKGIKPPLSVDCPSCGCTEYGWRHVAPSILTQLDACRFCGGAHSSYTCPRAATMPQPDPMTVTHVCPACNRPTHTTQPQPDAVLREDLLAWVRKQRATPWAESGSFASRMTGEQGYDAALEELEARLNVR